MTMTAKRTSRVSLEDILGDFDSTEPVEKSGPTAGAVTTWLSDAYKAKYDRLQKGSGRRFSKKVRQVIEALIDAAEMRHS